MKRKICLFLCCILILSLCIAPVSHADSTGICFVAVNERVLDLSYMPVYVGGTAYVHSSVFSYFGITYTYFKDSTAALLYSPSSGKQLYFEMLSGKTYDETGTHYSAQAVLRGGQTYVPVGFMCQMFGLRWSYVNGLGYGDILRITNGGEKLTDAQFLSAAELLMKERLNAYNAAKEPENGEDPETPDGPVIPKGAKVYLHFAGLPTAGMLDALKSYETPAGFFLTAEEILSAPDTVRRILGEGHSVGILLTEADPASEYAEGSRLLFETTRTRTLLVSAAESEDMLVRAYAAENGLVYWGFDIDGRGKGEGVTYSEEITSVLAITGAMRSVVRMIPTEKTERMLPDLLRYLERNEFDVRHVCEIENVG